MDALLDLTIEHLVDVGLDPKDIAQFVERTMAEDLGERGDLTSPIIISQSLVGHGTLVAREEGVFAGAPLIEAFVDIALSSSAGCALNVDDGKSFIDGDVLAELKGNTRELLALERSLLNTISHLCGIATETRKWVEAVSNTHAVIRDTRKTIPGLRALQKYAVRCGGGENHRMGMFDGVLIKDNHIVASGSVAKAVQMVEQADLAPEIAREVEVDSLDELKEAMEAGATCVLLDNMSIDLIAQAVAMRNSTNKNVKLEVSGGLRLENAKAVAETGVDYLAVGSLTHSVKAIDLGFDFS